MTLKEVQNTFAKLLFLKPNSSDEQEVMLCMLISDRILRGQIIGTFTIVEALMNDLTSRISSYSKELADEKNAAAKNNHLPMDIKKQLFKKAIEIYELKYAKDLSLLKDRMDNIIEKRHNLAHWILDTSNEGKKLYTDKVKLKFFNSEFGKQSQHIYFNKQSMKEFEASILSMQKALVTMQGVLMS